MFAGGPGTTGPRLPSSPDRPRGARTGGKAGPGLMLSSRASPRHRVLPTAHLPVHSLRFLLLLLLLSRAGLLSELAFIIFVVNQLRDLFLPYISHVSVFKSKLQKVVLILFSFNDLQ